MQIGQDSKLMLTDEEAEELANSSHLHMNHFFNFGVMSKEQFDAVAQQFRNVQKERKSIWRPYL